MVPVLAWRLMWLSSICSIKVEQLATLDAQVELIVCRHVLKTHWKDNIDNKFSLFVFALSSHISAYSSIRTQRNLHCCVFQTSLSIYVMQHHTTPVLKSPVLKTSLFHFQSDFLDNFFYLVCIKWNFNDAFCTLSNIFCKDLILIF